MHEGREESHLFWLKKAHILKICGMKQRCMSPTERDHAWIGVVKKDVLLILFVISTAVVTSRGGIVSTGRCFNS